MKGFLLVAETIERLQWSEFFSENGIEQYEDELALLKQLKDMVGNKDQNGSKRLLSAFLQQSKGLIDDFISFKESKSHMSETFTYWDKIVNFVDLLKDLVRADREGNWQLHLHTVQQLLPLFAVCDRVNYLRWCSVYLEDMRKLPETAPGVHASFCAGKFVVKRTEGHFNAIGADMCLEQTINKSAKSAAGIIGKTKRKDFVAQWQLIYHEMIEVSNLHRELSGIRVQNTELQANYEFSRAEMSADETKICDMMHYIKSYENPAHVPTGPHQKLHNIITQEIVTDTIREDLLKIDEKSKEIYTIFRHERFIAKEKQLCDTIHRCNMKTFKSLSGKMPIDVKKKKNVTKELSEVQKIIDIARVREYDIRKLFKFDLVSSTYLFDDNGLMTKPSKSDLCTELEKRLTPNEYVEPNEWMPRSSSWIVDVMSALRGLKVTSLKTYGELCSKLIEKILGICREPERIDFVFDTYLEGSVKDSERLRRLNDIPIEINNLTSATPLPVKMSTFWGSSANKTKLQTVLRCVIEENAMDILPQGEIVLSGTGIEGKTEIQPCMSVKNGNMTERSAMNIDIEEADARIVAHILDSAKAGMTRVVILANDTDVLVLALHHWHLFHVNGLQELWMRGGTGNTTRYIPVHIIANKIGQPLRRSLLALHMLTGTDCTSKFGTKAAALKAKPEMYLGEFGNDPDSIDFSRVEEFLVQVYKPGYSLKTMDEVRFNIYHQSKKSVVELPPTSNMTKAHILRAFYGTYIQHHCISGLQLKPEDFGYREEDGLLMPIQNHILLPDDFPRSCSCGKCATTKCICRMAGVACCSYCKCRTPGTEGCKNPNMLLRIPMRL